MIAYDDVDATFAVPVGGNYEVVFCPPGRSTKILFTAKAAQRALTSNGASEGANVSWLLPVIALVLTAGFFVFM